MDVNNIRPKLVKNFFDEEDMALIYKTIDGLIENNLKNGNDAYAKPFDKLEDHGFIVFYELFDPKVISKVKSGIESLVGHEVDEKGVFFARYSKKSGVNPSLLPHFDNVTTMNGHYATTTIQLKSTLDWDIYVEDEKFVMNQGDMLIFSGTGHIHWRPDVDFEEDDYFDIFLCQSMIKDGQRDVLNEEYIQKMDNLAGEYIRKYEHLLSRSYLERRERKLKREGLL